MCKGLRKSGNFLVFKRIWAAYMAKKVKPHQQAVYYATSILMEHGHDGLAAFLTMVGAKLDSERVFVGVV